MRRTIFPIILLAVTACALQAAAQDAKPGAVVPAPAKARPAGSPKMVIVDQQAVRVEEPPPHGAIGTSTAYRISDAAPERSLEFKRRTLHVGSAIGPHPITHDEVYYVLTGEGDVSSDDDRAPLKAGQAAYFYAGATVGIRQMGAIPLDLIITYPAPKPAPLLVDLDRAPDEVIELWPAGAPGGEAVKLNEQLEARTNRYNLPDHAAKEITRPTLSVFRAQQPDGSAILIAPGGGYSHVVVEKEGYEAARWFARRGATVYVMTYRLPHQGWKAGPDTPLQDAQRAIRLIRSRAKDDKIDPNRVIVMGFSAGGHLAGSLATRFAEQVYEPIDAADALSARPAAAALVYPVVTMRDPYAHQGSRTNLIGRTPSPEQIAKYSLETGPPADTPPVLLLHAADDPAVPVENSINFFAALKRAGVPAALQVFEKGNHGFGLRGIDKSPLRVWPQLVIDFGTAHGVFDAAAAKNDPVRD